MAVLLPNQVQLEENLVYGHGGGRELLCDVYRPAPETTRRTAVLHLHGGGFRGGSKAGARLARPLAARGYTCVSATYRVLPEVWPAQLEDVKNAINWIRGHASDLGVETNKLAILGYSAGGHLALTASGAPDTHLAACIAFYAPAHLRPTHPLLQGVSPELHSSASPVNNIKPGFPPTMVLHGTEDKTVPVDSAIALYSALREASVPVELHVVQGVTHIFDSHPEFAEASATWIDLFLDRHVVDPRVYPSTEPAPRPA